MLYGVYEAIYTPQAVRALSTVLILKLAKPRLVVRETRLGRPTSFLLVPGRKHAMAAWNKLGSPRKSPIKATKSHRGQQRMAVASGRNCLGHRLRAGSIESM